MPNRGPWLWCSRFRSSPLLGNSLFAVYWTHARNVTRRTGGNGDNFVQRYRGHYTTPVGVCMGAAGQKAQEFLRRDEPFSLSEGGTPPVSVVPIRARSAPALLSAFLLIKFHALSGGQNVSHDVLIFWPEITTGNFFFPSCDPSAVQYMCSSQAFFFWQHSSEALVELCLLHASISVTSNRGSRNTN